MPEPAQSSSRTLWMLAALAVLILIAAAVALLMLARPDRASQPVAAPARPVEATQPAEHPASPSPAAPVPFVPRETTPPPASPAAGIEPIDPDAELAPPPAPSPENTRPRPEQKPLTAGENRQRQEAALEMVDRTLIRLEQEQKAAERSGDTETAAQQKIRIERLHKRREAIAQALGQTD